MRKPRITTPEIVALLMVLGAVAFFCHGTIRAVSRPDHPTSISSVL